MAFAYNSKKNLGVNRKVKRRWHNEWELRYLFIEGQNGESICIICNETVSEKKSGKLERHFTAKHKDFNEKYPLHSHARSQKFEQLQKDLKCQQNIFVKRIKLAEAETYASNAVSWEIARHMKPFTDGEFVKHCMCLSAEYLLPAPEGSGILEKFKLIQLSARTVTRRIQNLANDVKEQLDNDLSAAQFISIALDESTDVTDSAQLCVFVRFITADSVISEEMLQLISLTTTTTGEDITRALINCLKVKKISFDKISSIATDGAPSMVGCHKGLVALLRQSGLFPNFVAYHCIIHEEALCAKYANIEDVMLTIVRVINFIRTRALNRREFRVLMDEMNSEYGDLLLHSEVRWLSRGRILERFSVCLPQILVFLESKNKFFPQMYPLKTFKYKLGYLTDIIAKFNELNLRLQGNGLLVCDLMFQINIMHSKLKVFKDHLEKCNVTHFPNLKITTENEEVAAAELPEFAKNIGYIIEQFDSRFSEFREMKKHVKLFCNTFEFEIEDLSDLDAQLDNSAAEMELLTIHCDEDLRKICPKKDLQNRYSDSVKAFWGSVNKECYPNIKKLVNRIMSMISTTYVCEQVFSSMKNIKSSNRNRLLDSNLNNLMIAATTQYTPNFTSSAGNEQISH